MFNRLLLVLFITLSVAANAGTQLKIAVLPFESETEMVSDGEIELITEIVRGAARKVLPTSQFVIMTQANILELLPPDKPLADCVGECAVEAGKLIGADYIVVGKALPFGDEIRIPCALYKVSDANLIKNEMVGGRGLLELEPALNDMAQKIFAPLKSIRVESANGFDSSFGRDIEAWTAAGSIEVVVEFSSNPLGAMLEIDGQPVSETPCFIPLMPGAYQISVKKVKYISVEQTLMVVERMDPFVAVLEPNFGWLSVNSEPAGMDVKLDGEIIGKTPIKNLETDLGQHTISINNKFYHQIGQNVVIGRNDHKDVSLNLVPRQGGIKVEARDRINNAVTGTVYVDGNRVGKTWTPITVMMGRHDISVKTPVGNWEKSVVVQEEKMQVLDVKLTGDLRAVSNKIRKQAIEDYGKQVANRKIGDTFLLVGGIAASVYSGYAYMQTEESYDQYMAAGSYDDMVEKWTLYEDNLNKARVGAIAGSVLFAWRIFNSFKEPLSEEQIYQDLLQKNKISLELNPGNNGSVMLALTGGF